MISRRRHAFTAFTLHLCTVLTLNTAKLRSILVPPISPSFTPTPLPKERITQPDRHCLRLRVIGQGRLTQLASDTRLLEATEGKLVVEHVVAVDPYRAGLERVADTDGRVDVVGVHSSGKTVGGAIADLDGVLFRLELGDRADRAEDFLLHNLHVFTDV